MTVEYEGREQTQAKHSILKGYLSAFANKLINSYDIAYIDGFSGPWEAKSDQFSDTSFGIALEVILQAHKLSLGSGRPPKKVRCFFVEKNPSSFQKLSDYLASYNSHFNFEVRDFCGEFEDAIPDIELFAKGYFPLLFIDPKGWTGFNLEKMRNILRQPKSEILVNFMYDFIQRGVSMSDHVTTESFNGILGGTGWKEKLDSNMRPGDAALELFKSHLKTTGGFSYVVDAEITMATKDRPHYHLVYGTKSYVGLQVFRHQQFKTKEENERFRLIAKRRKVDDKTGTLSFLPEIENVGPMIEADEKKIKQELNAVTNLVKLEAITFVKAEVLFERSMKFEEFSGFILEKFVLKETHAKDICVQLAKDGFIEDTWSFGRKSKPISSSIIKAKSK